MASKFDVLEDVNAEVAAGEFVCIVGPSGCGKSTLLNIVGGFLPRPRATLLVEGEPRQSVPTRAAFLSFRRTASFPG